MRYLPIVLLLALAGIALAKPAAKPKVEPTRTPPTTLTIRPCEVPAPKPLVCLRVWADHIDGIEALDATLILPERTMLDGPKPVAVMAAVGCLPMFNANVPGILSFGMACVDPRATISTAPSPLVQFFLRTGKPVQEVADHIGVQSCRINEEEGRCR